MDVESYIFLILTPTIKSEKGHIYLLQIRAADSPYRFAGSLAPQTILSSPQKMCSIAERFHLLLFPLDESIMGLRLVPDTT